MDIIRFIMFFATLLLIFTSVEVYTYFSWKRFVKRYDLNKLFYKIPKYITITVLILTAVSMFGGIFWQTPNWVRFFIMVLVAVWIMPKLGIVLFLLVKDINRLAAYLIRKFTKKESDPGANLSRRKVIESAGWSLASIPFIIVTKGLVSTTYDFRVHKVEVPIPKLPAGLDGIKIAQISDLHLGSFYDHKPFQEVKRRIEALKPDIILMTGDFVNNRPVELKPNYNDLKALESDLGVYSCLGNHDHYMRDSEHRQLLRVIDEVDFNILNNTSKQLIINNCKVNLIGVDNYGMNQTFGDFDRAFEGIEEDAFNIFLCHDPRNWEQFIVGKKPADLMLAGHTHGGQVAWDFSGYEFRPVRLAYKHSEGLYKESDQFLYVNRGIGTVGPPMRIGVPPEITEITLRSV